MMPKNDNDGLQRPHEKKRTCYFLSFTTFFLSTVGFLIVT